MKKAEFFTCDKCVKVYLVCRIGMLAKDYVTKDNVSKTLTLFNDLVEAFIGAIANQIVNGDAYNKAILEKSRVEKSLT